MDIYIIHGEHSTKSYIRLQKYLDKAREGNWKITNLNAKSNIDFREALTTQDLFRKKHLIVVTDSGLLKNKDLVWLKKKNENLDGYLIIYSKNSLRGKLLSSLPKVKKIEEFKLPKNVFDFLNSIYPKNSKKSLELLNEIKKHEPIEFIFYLLSRHMRDLYWTKVSPSNIPYSSWRVAKLENQASRFSVSKLKEFINKLSETDYKVKTSSKNLSDSLDLLLIRQLE